MIGGQHISKAMKILWQEWKDKGQGIPATLKEVSAVVLNDQIPNQLAHFAAGEHHLLQTNKMDPSTADICRLLVKEMNRRIPNFSGKAMLSMEDLLLALQSLGIAGEHRMPPLVKKSSQFQTAQMVCDI